MPVFRKPLCIIPARGASKRFPRKNLALLAGKPLLAYALEAAFKSQVFETVCVSSEDEEILEAARRHGAPLVLKRPPELATDTAQVRQVCLYLLEDFLKQGHAYREFGVMLLTNPLRIASDIIKAYEIFQHADANYVMSLVPFSHPPQRAVWAPHGYVEPYFGPQYMKPAQVLAPLFRHDGSIIFGKSEVFLREKEFFGSKVAPYFMPVERSVDIDTPLDLEWAEFLMTRHTLRGKPAIEAP
jgi:CMP-N-acetylneuraminic acid synthetase